MTRHRVPFRGTAGAALVVAALAVGAGVPALAAVPDGRWHRPGTPVPAGRLSSLLAADLINAGTLWATGYVTAGAQPADYPVSTLAMRWAGGAWTPTTVADPVTENGGESGRSVAAAGASDGWLVSQAWDVPVVRRWNGTEWRRVPFDLLDDGGNPVQLGTVDAAGGRAWVIATGIFDDISSTRVAAWDGTAWSWLPDLGFAYGDLTDVAALARNDVWFVGGGFDGGLVYQWNGRRWVDRLPARPDLSLSKVTATAANDVWVTGDRLVGEEWGPVLLHWDGDAWTEVAVPAQLTTAGIAAAPGGVWLSAVPTRADRSRYLHYDGTEFTVVEGPAWRDAFSVDVEDVVTLPGRAEPFAVGSVEVLGRPERAMTEVRRPVTAVQP